MTIPFSVRNLVDNYYISGLEELLNLPKTGKIRKMEPEHRYSFVSAEQDVDYVRIVREAPAGTLFIVVEERNRFTNRAKGWVLLVHNTILRNDDLKYHNLAGETLGVCGGWGQKDLPNGKELFSYRFVVGSGKFPREILQEIEKLKKLVSKKNTITTVEYK